MSKFDSSLSKDQFNLLKQFKKQISNPHPRVTAEAPVKKAVEPEQPDDLELFYKEMRGVQKIDSGNQAQIQKPARPKVDAQTLAKRAAAEGPPQIGRAHV